MRTFASIRSRQLRITGHPQSGWRAVDDDENKASKVLPFNFDITDDGTGNFLLVYQSLDGVYYGDTWHETETLDDAYTSAERQFGVSRSQWIVS